jgi:VanZ family protein
MMPRDVAGFGGRWGMAVQRLVRWLPAAAWLIVIFGLSSIPDQGPPRFDVVGLDKLAHLTEYAVLGFLVARAVSPGRAAVWAVLAGLLAGVLIGSLDETYQRTVPGRDVDALDVVADAVGASVGGWLNRWWRTRRRQPADAGTRNLP